MDEERSKSRAASEKKIVEAMEAHVSGTNLRTTAIRDGNEILMVLKRVDVESEDAESDRTSFFDLSDARCFGV